MPISNKEALGIVGVALGVGIMLAWSRSPSPAAPASPASPPLFPKPPPGDVGPLPPAQADVLHQIRTATLPPSAFEVGPDMSVAVSLATRAKILAQLDLENTQLAEFPLFSAGIGALELFEMSPGTIEGPIRGVDLLRLLLATDEIWLVLGMDHVDFVVTAGAPFLNLPATKLRPAISSALDVDDTGPQKLVRFAMQGDNLFPGG